ncbi:Gldg family protein [Pseudobacter ginsenosidimutans]|uniref:ABC-2 type transport system permease protein n=1 Tax=Pseudobacter ginsenosidimutans TaxID=661488 RepID=A0A4V2EZ72_9BACT|nr:Gldg family protein [Pseudobacter ginsenosidimutans]RZS65480.1 ABC-2 type transport system permease protein [Pseudobacter ginsenosidimutans]
MRLIIRIAKNEMRYLFYSPIAWIVLLAFWVLIALDYFNQLHDMANVQEIMVKNSNPNWTWLPRSVTGMLFGRVYQTAVSYLYLFIPLLTMGLISREKNAGTIKLLYSSPAGLRQIVFGKYLGIMLYLLMLVTIVGIVMIMGVMDIRKEDYGLFISGLIGFYLLCCAYSAIGMFMSAISIHPVISAISTFMIIFVLDRVGMLWQQYDFIRDITWFLSLQNRTQKMIFGLVVTRDIFYFLLITFIFVSFTIIRLQSGRESRSWYIKTGRYVLVVVVALLTGYLTARPVLTKYWDSTANKGNTIPPELQQMLRTIGDSSLEVTLYVNILSRTSTFALGMPEKRNPSYLTHFWDQYLRFKPDIKFKYEYFYDIDPQTSDSAWFDIYPGKTISQIALKVAERHEWDISQFKTPEEIRKIVDLKKEGNRMVMLLKYKGRTEVARTMNDTEGWPDRDNMASVLKRLLEPDKISTIYFLTGNLERDIRKRGDRGYYDHTDKSIRSSLANMGFDIDTLNLNTQDVPGDMATLVLADPIMDVSTGVQTKIKRYIDTGGNMMILGKPGKQYVLNPLLQHLGVQLLNGQIVQPSYDETPEKVIALAAPAVDSLSWRTEGLYAVGMPFTTGVDSIGGSSFSANLLLYTVPKKTWLKAGELIIDSTLPDFNALAGDMQRETFATSLQLTRSIGKKEQRIIVFGGADFISNLRIAPNLDFIEGAHSWLTYNHFPVALTRILPVDILLTVSERGAYVQKILFIWILPGALLLGGTILLIRRKRK